MGIEKDIQQTNFKSELHKAHLNILYTASWLNQKTTQSLKAYKISPQQFNILRILRGRHPEPASIKLLTERMLDKMSNASRLVDKLKAKGLVERLECPDDRRRVDVNITEKGLKLLEKASEAVEQGIIDFGTALEEPDAKQLNNYLDKMREE